MQGRKTQFGGMSKTTLYSNKAAHFEQALKRNKEAKVQKKKDFSDKARSTDAEEGKLYLFGK